MQRREAPLRAQESTSRTDLGFSSSYAPAIHTPRPDRRSIRFVHPSDDASDGSNSVDSQVLEDLCGKRWKLFQVSPLHRFQYSRIRLKQYGKKLREYLSILVPGENVQYEAKFSVVPDLTRSQTDYEAFQISVSCSKNGQVVNLDYEGVFISWGSTRPQMRQQDVVSLPLLLCRGSLRMINPIHYLLGQFFDCSISRLLLTEMDLFWLSAMLPAMCSVSRKSNRVNFRYSVPGTTTRGSLTFCCMQQTLIDIWKSVCTNENDELLYSEVVAVHDVLMGHILSAYGINTGKCILDHVTSGDLQLASDGMFRVRTTSLADRVLDLLCNISVIIENPKPSLSL